MLPPKRVGAGKPDAVHASAVDVLYLKHADEPLQIIQTSETDQFVSSVPSYFSEYFDMSHISENFTSHIDVVTAFYSDPAQMGEIEKAIMLCVTALKNNKKLLFCGNGGSAADSQHLATELTIRFSSDRPAIAAIALTTDTSALTAAGNDIGFDRVFSRQVEALGQGGDVLMAFSTSGNSGNVVLAVEEAKRRRMSVVFFGGGSGGKIMPLADASLIVPSKMTARIQECHILIGHILCGAIETELGYVD